jgi:hypothetical protein
MSEMPQGYKAYWMRIARHVGLSAAAKQIGVRASELTSFEKGGDHSLTAEQLAAYIAYLESVPIPEAEIPAGDESE